MEPKYTIERHEHGWLVRGAIPVNDITWIMRLIPGDGIADAQVSQALGGSMALTTEDGSRAWRAALELTAVRD
jgi:hypothetical protein